MMDLLSQAQKICPDLPMWPTSAGGLEVVIRVKEGQPDPFHFAVRLLRALKAQPNLATDLAFDYSQNAITLTGFGVVIHWITGAGESHCAEALAELKTDKATLSDVQAAFTLPYDWEQAWVETNEHADRQALTTWRVPGLGYFVAIQAGTTHPILKDSEGQRIYPTWLPLAEAARIYGYSPSSLRQAVYQGRLRTARSGDRHRVTVAEIEAAIAEGRLQPDWHRKKKGSDRRLSSKFSERSGV